MKFVPNKVTRSIGRSILKTKKNSPHIFFAGGVIGVAAGTVLACRATLRAGDVLDEVNHDVGEVKKIAEKRLKSSDNKYDESEYYKDLAYVYGKGGGKFVRLYAPAVVVSGVSIAALTGAHIQLTRRNASLTAALATVSAAYDKYREYIREEFGEEKELEIYHNVRKEAVENTDGSKEVVRIGDTTHSPYARFFDEYNPNWKKDAEYNKMFVMTQQTYANHLLQARGHVFLNDVYDLFGFERSSAGAVVGWVLEGSGDGYIDFGIYEAHNSDFVSGRERSIILDFNVDGVIYDLIEEQT